MIMEKELNSIPVPLVYKPKPIPVEVVQQFLPLQLP